jgi:hypothetical protein
VRRLGNSPSMSREIEGRSATAKATARRASRRGTKKAQARKLSGLGSGDVLLIRSLPRRHTRCPRGLDCLPAGFSARRVLCWRSRASKLKTPPGEPSGVFILAMSYSRAAYRRTTIGAAAFHCRVRNGNGWCHCAIITRGPSRTGVSLHRSDASASRHL